MSEIANQRKSQAENALRSLNFPTPVGKGELIFSMVARCARLESDPEPNQLLRDLFGAVTAMPLNPLPTGLGFFFEHHGHKKWASVGHLMEDHSILPLCRAMLKPVTMRGVLDHSLQDPTKETLDKVGKLDSASVRVSGEGSCLRFCPACRTEEIADPGFPIWSRSHQVPWVSVCWRHGVQLISHCPLCKKPVASIRSLRMPPRACNCGHVFKKIFSTKAEQQIAFFYHTMMECAESHIDPLTRSNLCRSKALEMGFASTADFAKAFDEWAEQEAEGAFNSSIDPYARAKLKIEGSYVSEIMYLRRPKNPPRTLTSKEIMALPFLFSGWPEFVKLIPKRLSENAENADVKENEAKGSRPRLKVPRDAIVLALKNGESPSDLAEKYGIPVLHVYHIAHRFEIDADCGDWQPDKKRVKLVIRMLSEGYSAIRASRESGMTHKECLAIVHAYADKIAVRVAKVRESIAKNYLDGLLRTGQARSRAELRRTRYYAEINAKDPEWVNRAIAKYVGPSAKRVDWKARDLELSERLLVIAKELENRRGGARVTQNVICRELGIQRKLNSDLLPRFCKELSKIVESAQEAGDRRIEEVLRSLGYEPSFKDLCRLAHCDRKILRDYLNRTRLEYVKAA